MMRASVEAVASESDTVVLAGPGSGKTATLVCKAAHLTLNVLPQARGVACVAFSNDAVAEFTVRLRNLGVESGRRMLLATAHGFCLRAILRPYAALAGRDELVPRRILSSVEQTQILERALEAAGVHENARFYGAQLARYRFRSAASEDVEGLGDEVARVASLLHRDTAREPSR